MPIDIIHICESMQCQYKIILYTSINNRKHKWTVNSVPVSIYQQNSFEQNSRKKKMHTKTTNRQTTTRDSPTHKTLRRLCSQTLLYPRFFVCSPISATCALAMYTRSLVYVYENVVFVHPSDMGERYENRIAAQIIIIRFFVIVIVRLQKNECASVGGGWCGAHSARPMTSVRQWQTANNKRQHNGQ